MSQLSLPIDDYRHKGLRKKLIQSLREKGISDERILEAFDKVPRHFFMDKAFEEKAYEDKPFPIGFKQTISQPYTVAYQTMLLNIQKRDKVLEIGTGSGFQACILAALGAQVYTIERQEGLFVKTKKLLERLGYYQIKMFLKDGFQGLPTFAPFDKILITAAPEDLPQELIAQLKTGGIMVVPKGGREVQTMLIVTKVTDSSYKVEEMDHFVFVPMLSGVVNVKKHK